MGMKISGNAGRVLFCCQSWLRSRSLLFVWFYFWSFPAAYCPELAEVGVQCPLKCPAHFAVQIHPGGGGQVLKFCFFSPVVITWTFFFWIALAVPEGVWGWFQKTIRLRRSKSRHEIWNTDWHAEVEKSDRGGRNEKGDSSCGIPHSEKVERSDLEYDCFFDLPFYPA